MTITGGDHHNFSAGRPDALVQTASLLASRDSLVSRSLRCGGFVGNFALSLADHAQIGFFDGRKWLAVNFAAGDIGLLVTATFLQPNRRFIR